MPGSIVMLSGPVGAGKSAIAAELVRPVPGPSSPHRGRYFWFFIVRSGADHSRVKGFRMVMRAMTAAAAQYARDGYEVILDFSIPPWAAERLKASRHARRLRCITWSSVRAWPVCAARAARGRRGRSPTTAPTAACTATSTPRRDRHPQR